MRLRSPRLCESFEPSPSVAARIGNELRDARLAAGETVETVADVLRIRAAYLAALEQGDHGQLPGPIYVRGFIRSYGDYLGLSGRRLLAMLEGSAEAVAAPPLVPPVPAVQSGGARGNWIVALSLVVAAGVYGGWQLQRGEVGGEPATAREAPGDAAGPAASDGAGYAPAVALAAARGLGHNRITLVADDAPAPSLDELRLRAPDVPSPGQLLVAATATGPSSAVAAEQAFAAEPSAPTPTAGAMLAALQLDGAPPSASQDNGRIALVARDTSWVQVRSASRDFVRTRTLESGERLSLPDRPDLALWTGNAGALELWVDGRMVGTAGAVGHVVRELPLDPAALLAKRPPPR